MVDQSPEILNLIDVVLREGGFAVQTATSYEEALKKAALAVPCLAIVDIGLAPAADEDFVAALDEMYGSRVPIVLTTAGSEQAFDTAIRRTGAIDGIRKPFDIAELLVRVRRAAGLRRSLSRRRVRQVGSMIPTTVYARGRQLDAVERRSRLEAGSRGEL